ncbi:MAG: DUF2461 domain-containing protein [Holophagaceae bacterium]|nr:DUF2461 domain-containing protein [Holophagaceae bacterium]
MATKAIRTDLENPLGPELFRFLKDLKANNDRAWFQEHKARYEAEARDPVLRLIAGFGGPLASVSRHFAADPRPMGGSLFRIHRDTRFSKDKTPYKTHLGVNFRHRSEAAGGVHGPGFYLHLEPGGCFAGGGLWHPEPEALYRVRQAIVAKTAAWKKLRASGIEIEGEALKRVPQGFDPDHPCAEDLKLKDFYAATAFTDAQVLAPDFPTTLARACQEAAPLVAFLSKALDLPF